MDARQLHRDATVVDCHNDLPVLLLMRNHDFGEARASAVSRKVAEAEAFGFLRVLDFLRYANEIADPTAGGDLQTRRGRHVLYPVVAVLHGDVFAVDSGGFEFGRLYVAE